MPWGHDEIVLTKDGESLSVVTFMLGEEEFGFDISKVKEIIRVGDITRVPKSPEFIVGVINLRGNIVPLIDLRKRFLWDSIAYTSATRIIVVEVAGLIAGFIVDAVLETKQIQKSSLETAPIMVMGGLENEYITGVAKLEGRLVVLLEIEKILLWDIKDTPSQSNK